MKTNVNKYLYVTTLVNRISDIQTIFFDLNMNFDQDLNEKWKFEIFSDIWLSLMTAEYLLSELSLVSFENQDYFNKKIVDTLNKFEQVLLPYLINNGFDRDLKPVIHSIKELCQQKLR